MAELRNGSGHSGHLDASTGSQRLKELIGNFVGEAQLLGEFEKRKRAGGIESFKGEVFKQAFAYIDFREGVGTVGWTFSPTGFHKVGCKVLNRKRS